MGVRMPNLRMLFQLKRLKWAIICLTSYNLIYTNIPHNSISVTLTGFAVDLIPINFWNFLSFCSSPSDIPLHRSIPPFHAVPFVDVDAAASDDEAVVVNFDFVTPLLLWACYLIKLWIFLLGKNLNRLSFKN